MAQSNNQFARNIKKAMSASGFKKEVRRKRLVKAARAEYQTDEIEIDDNAKISKSDDGAWVAAWVWISNQDEANHN